MIESWKSYESEKEKKIFQMQLLEIKIISMKNKLTNLEEKLHNLRNEFTVWDINTKIDLEEKILKRS